MPIAPPEILTANGRLRRVVKGDLSAFSEMNADPRVMGFFPRPWSFEESHAALERIEIGFSERGFGIYALEFDKEFAGIVGLSVPTFEAYFTPCIEILWRLLPRFWGKGLVSEAGTAVLQMAFQTLRMPEIVAFTAEGNLRSIRVMERLGMERDQRVYFDHPAVTEIRLQRYVLYRTTPKLSIAE
jgi:RimJ/RimL family protein N-acetyltransferase